MGSYDKRIWEKPNTKIVFLDIDGVVGDFELHWQSPKWQNWNISDLPKEFWETIPLFNYSHNFYNALKEIAPVVFLTSPSSNPECVAGKHFWIEKHFKTRDFLLGGCKWACAHPNSMLIDDSIGKIDRFKAAGGATIHFSRTFPWTAYVEMVKEWVNAGN